MLKSRRSGFLPALVSGILLVTAFLATTLPGPAQAQGGRGNMAVRPSIAGAHREPGAKARQALDRVRGAMSRGDVAGALEANLEAARLDSLSSVVFEMLGVTYLEARQPRDAYAALRRASLLEPSSLSILNRAGQLLLSYLGRPAGALAAFRQVLIMSPDFAPAHYSLSVYHLLRGELDQAEREGELAFATAETEAEQAAFFGAKLQLLLHRGPVGDAEQSLRGYLHEHPEDRRARQSHALSLRLLGHFDQAAEEIHGLLSQVQPQAVLLNELGLVEEGLGKRDTAEVLYRSAWDLDSTAAEAGYHLARARLAGQDTSGALSWLAKVEAREPDWFPTAALAARIHAARGDSVRARRASARAWQLRPIAGTTEPASLVARSREALLAGDLALALDLAYQASGDAKTRTEALLLAADASRPSGLSPGAPAATLEAALESVPSGERVVRAAIERELGVLHAWLGNRADAREHLDKSLALVPATDPLSAPAVAERIAIELDAGDRAAAAALAARAAAVDDPALLAARARLAEVSGDAARAASFRERARAMAFLP